MVNLKNKNILIFSPSFFGYEFEIKKELEHLGANVFLYDERPKNDFITKSLIRLNYKKIIKKKIDKYYNKILEAIIDEKINYLFLISPETIDPLIIDKIKNYFKDIKIYVYMWDSLKNKKMTSQFISISEKFYTFDSDDIKSDDKLKFLPLFYIDEYEKLNRKQTEVKYDLTFIGTVHSDRYTIIKKIETIAKKNGLRTFIFLYSPSKILFFIQKFLLKNFSNIKLKEISFKSLNKCEIAEIIGQSKVVVDIQHYQQSGLTMRTIEVLGAKRKLLTTNKCIKNYDFYNKDNVQVFDRDDIKLDMSFFMRDYKDIEEKIYKKYSLREWIKRIFC